MTHASVTRNRMARGQTLAELGILLSFLLVLGVGLIEFGFVLYQGHVVVKVAREGANLISRRVSLADVEAAIRTSRPTVGAFDANTRVILSVVKVGAGGANLDAPIITQRHVVGSVSGASAVGDPPASSYSGGPDYVARDPDNDPSIRARSPLPNGLRLTEGQSVYMAEVYIRRQGIVSLSSFGITLPTTLYSVAFF